MDIVSLIIQLVSGAAGGNVAGALLKKFSLGTVLNSIVGLLGGGLGGQILSMIMGGAGAAGAAAPAAGALDIGSILQQVAGGGVGGGLLLTIVGIIKNMMNKGGSVQ